MTHDTAKLMSAEAARVLHGLHPFAARLGSPDGLESLTPALSALQLAPIRSASSLRAFLHSYRDRVLLPTELPVIQKAYMLASRGQTRELVALDQAAPRGPVDMPFSELSAAIGRIQMSRLKPMKGNRVLSRYMEAVTRGEAKGWHTIAYGLILASFAMPLRQGLVHYSESALHGFVESASGLLQLSEAEQSALTQEACLDLGPAINELLGPVCLTVA